MKIFLISEVANLFNITRQTLIYYDKIGLFRPMITDEETSYRYYTEEQFLDLSFILSLKSADFSLKEILEYFESMNQKESLSYLEKKIEAINNKISNLEKAKKIIENKQKDIKQTMIDYVDHPLIEEIEEKTGFIVKINEPKDDFEIFMAEKKIKSLLKINKLNISPRFVMLSNKNNNNMEYIPEILAVETKLSKDLILEKGVYATIFHRKNETELDISYKKLEEEISLMGYKKIENRDIYYEATVPNRGGWQGILIKIYIPVIKI